MASHHSHGGHQGHHGHHGHQGHVVVVPGRKKGGKIGAAGDGAGEPKEPKPKEDERTKEQVAEDMKTRKYGGAVKGRAVGGRLDRRARGGRMTPNSPLSGADVKKAPYESRLKGVDEGGKGTGLPHP